MWDLGKAADSAKLETASTICQYLGESGRFPVSTVTKTGLLNIFGGLFSLVIKDKKHAIKNKSQCQNCENKGTILPALISCLANFSSKT